MFDTCQAVVLESGSGSSSPCLKAGVSAPHLGEWGFLAFMDRAAGSALAHLLDQDPDAANSIIEAAEDHEPESCQFLLDEQSGLNFVTFPCNGPGVSPAFFGLADDGSVVCLVIDCGYNARPLLV
jgi:hypothetical protein